MDNKDLILLVEEIAGKQQMADVICDQRNGIGKSQFRALAEICEKADFYEEIKLMIEYKTAKGNGWDKKVGEKKFGEVIIDYIKRIRERCREEGKNEKELLENIGLFFGYLHWKSAVLISNSESSRNSRSDDGYQGNRGSNRGRGGR